VSFWTLRGRACREAGVSFCLYDLRHTFATRKAEAGVDLATLGAILGHNGLRTVTKYVHPTRQHMRAAMLGPAATISPQPQDQAYAIH